MNLLLITGTVAHTPALLYHRLLRPDSITRAQGTGFGSRASNSDLHLIKEIYCRAFQAYQHYLEGRLTSRDLIACIRHLCLGNLTARDRQELAFEAQRLRSCIAAQRARMCR
jgi:hypothetical protein